MIGDLFNMPFVPIEDILKFDFNSFKEKGHLLDESNKRTINEYYDKCYVGLEPVPFYHCLPVLNTVAGNHEYRFLLVAIENDLCFVAYKIIQIMTTKQIRVFDAPISRNGLVFNEKMVIDVLSKKTFIKFAVQKHFLSYYENKKIEKYEWYNNYYYSYSVLKSLPNRKLRRWRLKSLTENNDFTFGLFDSIGMELAKEIRDDFNKYIIERNGSTSKKDEKEFLRLCTIKTKNKKIMPIFYKGTLISITVFIVFNNVAYNLYQIERKHYDGSDYVLDKMLKYNMEEKTKYLAFNLFENVERIYILGAMPTEARLIEHKERTSDGKIEYYIIQTN